MANEHIYILDSNQSESRFLNEFFKKIDYTSTVLEEIPDTDSEHNLDDAILYIFDYNTIVRSEREKVIQLFKSPHNKDIVVFNVPNTTNRRLAFYDLGARRVYDTSYPLEEVCMGLRWILESISSTTADHHFYSKGQLEDVALPVLINSLGKENRTGVLKIVTASNSGKIYFYNGDIDDAWVSGHSGNQAILHMLLWNKGTFYFSPAQHEHRTNRISLSNIGLILLAEKIRRDYLQKLSRIGASGSTVRIKDSGDLLASDLNVDPVFVEFLKKPRLLDEALDNPIYTNFITAEELAMLKECKFLVVNEPVQSLLENPLEKLAVVQTGFDEVILNRDEIEQFKNNLNISESQTGKLVILGTEKKAKSDFINQLTKTNSAVKGNKDLEVARVTMGSDLDLLLFGVTIDQMVLETAEKLSEGLVGYIFLVDATSQQDFEYTNYVINHLLNLFPVPCTVAVTGLEEQAELESVRRNFVGAELLNWMTCNISDPSCIHDVLLSMELPAEPEAEEEDKSETEESNEEEEQVEQTVEESEVEPNEAEAEK